jgi:hypothetical protein
MTTTQIAPDWKTTLGRRILIRVAALLVALSAYTAVAAVIVDVAGAWWLVAGLALASMLAGAMAPAPVPSDLITGERSRHS